MIEKLIHPKYPMSTYDFEKAFSTPIMVKVNELIDVVNSLEERGVTHCEPAHDRIEEIRREVQHMYDYFKNQSKLSEMGRGYIKAYASVLSLFDNPKPR